MWKIIDENYCFFEYKEIDWDQVHSDYLTRVQPDMSQEALFTLLNEMLQELKDGHVNIFSSFDVGRYWKWFEDYPDNYKQELIDAYLGTNYQIAGGMRYKPIEDSIGYIRYADFSSPIGESNLDYVIRKFNSCRGIIIDIRNNGGGYLTNADKLASRFFNEKTLVGYIQHKTGKGHDDFSEPYPKYIEPSIGLRYLKKVIILTNRRCYRQPMTLSIRCGKLRMFISLGIKQEEEMRFRLRPNCLMAGRCVFLHVLSTMRIWSK